ncbi:MAG: amidophosphoribosyltransferase [Thermoplasmata archaeon]|nr:MAG: amidophosphoribosyltransferase [Thermoplasmata archaeon]
MSGVFGVVGMGNCTNNLFYGVDYHSHLGTQRGGLAVYNKETKKIQRKIHDITQSQFKSKFFDDYKDMNGNSGIGVISDMDSQPIIISSSFGNFAIVTAGLIENAEELALQLQNEGLSFSEMDDGTLNTTEVIGKLITRGENIIDGIEKMFDKIKGSVSLLLLTEEGIYAARDRHGHTPLVVGKKDHEHVVVSETCSLPNLGFNIVKYLGPGEIVLLKEGGLSDKKGPESSTQICAFLWIYTGYPASSYEGISVEGVRERTGKCLAKNDDIELDFASGVPDSGTAHGIGYAMGAKVPFRRPLVKYTSGYGRSYTPPSQEIRDMVATMKLIPIKEVIKDNRMVLCEDSIVRGTQLRNFTVQKLWDNEAKEVHIRVACPPLMFPCRYILSTRTISELAARRAIRALEGNDIEDVTEYIDSNSVKFQKMVEWIKDDLGVTSLKYQTLDDMIRAIGLPKESLCLHCWCGK